MERSMVGRGDWAREVVAVDGLKCVSWLTSRGDGVEC